MGGDLFFLVILQVSSYWTQKSSADSAVFTHTLIILTFRDYLAKLTNFCFWYCGGVLSFFPALYVCSVRRLLDLWYIDTTYRCYHVLELTLVIVTLGAYQVSIRFCDSLCLNQPVMQVALRIHVVRTS